MIQTKSHRKYLFTPLRYPGGKISLFEFFNEVIEIHGWHDVIYVEPYAGRAGTALSLLILGHNQRPKEPIYDAHLVLG